MKLYVEDNQTIPAVLILQDADTPPSGYTEKTSIEDWFNYGRNSLGAFFGFNYLTWRGKINELMIAIVNADFSNWNGLSTPEKEIVSGLILAPYSLRTGVVSDTVDQRNWKKLIVVAQGTPVEEFTGRAKVVEKMREAVSEELRVDTMTKADSDSFFTDVSAMIDTFIHANTPDFKQWLTNEVGSPYETDGFEQKTYYSQAREDYLLDIYNGQF